MNSSSLTLSMESMVPYPQFYRLYGIRRAVQLVGPIMSPISKLELPRDSILHFVPMDESELGLPQDDMILHQVPRTVFVNHNVELKDSNGQPRSTQLSPSKLISDYHRKYRMMRRLNNYETATRDARSLVVENYGLLPHLFRYQTSFFRGYYKWWNIHATMFARIKELASTSQREQYLVCKLPVQLPSLSRLARAEASMTRSSLVAFKEPEALFILELWRWLGEKRNDSVLAKAGADAMKQLNLIWEESGTWCVLNMGLLESWRRPTSPAEGKEQLGQIPANQLQKRFLRMLMYLYEARTVAAPEGEHAQVEVPSTQQVKPAPLKITLPSEDGKVNSMRIRANMDIDHLPDDKVEENHDNQTVIDDAITRDLEALTHLEEQYDDGELGMQVEEPSHTSAGTSFPVYHEEPRSLEDGVMVQADALADQGLLSGAEYRRLKAMSTAYQNIKDPYGRGGTLAGQSGAISPKTLQLENKPQIPDKATVIDKSMLKSSLFEFDSRYIKDVMKIDVLNSVLGMQQAGVAITDYEITKVDDAMTSSEIHSVQLTPVNGRPSTIRFTLPQVQSDGTFRSNGVRYRMRKQRGDLPIRKLSPTRVALTSYYAKLFVSRSEKQVHNYAGWLTNQIATIGMDNADERVSQLMLSDVFDSTNHTPRMYSILAQRFRSFNVGEYSFFFDYAAREAYFGKEVVDQAERDGMVIVGRQGKAPLVMDQNDIIYALKVVGDTAVMDDKLTMIGDTGQLEQLLGLQGKAPLEMVEVKVFGKLIPLGMALAYQLGLSQLLQVLKVTPRRVATGERLNLSEDEYALRFEDETLVFSRENKIASQILSGIGSFEKSTRNYPIHLFDKKDIYGPVLEQSGIGMRYLRELDLMMDLFIDPITREILQERKEPTSFIGLLLKANELLLSDWSPDETDMQYMRIKGYERVAGAVYSELSKAIRLQRARGSVARAKIELPPYSIWQTIQQDPAVKLVEESNPIHNLKEKEEVTYSGVGGRSDRSMTAQTRVFHKNDMGVISEATKDSATVAITTFLTADPNLHNLRGLTRAYDEKVDGPTAVLSSSALLAPAADRDDPKRVNFISIQQSAGTFAKGYRASPLRTGYEQIVADRTDDLYAYTAKGKAEVTALSAKAITLTYQDGSEVSVELGRRFGTAAGETYPHEIVTSLQLGDKVKPGDIVSYNTHYFELDPLNPKQAIWKAGVLVYTAIMESTDTLEDSSAISERCAELLETRNTKVRDLIVRFDQTIHNLVQPGAQVDFESILCTIEDPVTARNKLFDDSSIETLRLIAANTPKAKARGVVEKVEIFYHGDIDEMSPSLQDLSSDSDRNRKRLARDMKVPYTAGKVDGSMRIDGKNLPPEQAVIKIYITGEMSAGVGDKGVFGNQMKTIFGRVMSGTNETESGVPIDAIFGYTSISDRIVLSPEIMGTTTTLLKIMSQHVVDIYEGNK